MDENQTEQNEQPAPAIMAGPDFVEVGTPEQVTALYFALAEARGEFAPIVKNRTSGKGTNKEFRYADLDASLDATVPGLRKHGLVLIQPLSFVNGKAQVRTTIAHKDGGRLYVYFDVPMPTTGDVQDFGKNVTYSRRYCYNAALCLAADQDLDDAPAASGQAAKRDTPQTPQTRQAGAQPSPTRAAQPGAAQNGSGVAKTPAGSSPAAQSNGQPGQSANAAPSPAGASAAQPGPAEAQPVPLSREQWDQLLRMCSAAGATEKEDQRSLISGFLPDGTTKPDASHFKTLVTKLGQLAIDRKESANV
jgi:hypothetical protein